MPRYPKYKLSKLAIAFLGERPALWTFGGKPVSGIERTYSVVDSNFKNRNVWEFLIRVPEDPAERIEVRPRAAPPLKVWAGLERRSVTFVKAGRPNYRGWHYCQVSLADPTDERTRDVIKGAEREKLPPWFEEIEPRLRLKDTVRSTRGNDGNTLVTLVRPDEHDLMIGLFFATKVWVLKEGVILDA
jgi:hypothetical protein